MMMPFVITFGLAASASMAQESRCADCHIANPQADPDPDHTFDWEMSPHGRNAVGCEKCHSGDATTFESFLAHKGILNSRNPASPTHRTNLPRTCGLCHTGPFVAFQRSQHDQLLKEGSGEGPTCSTCHGAVGARLLSPRSLEKQCESCHGPGRVSPHREFPVEGRVLMQEVGNVRDLLAPVPRLLRRIDDEKRREALEEAYQQAQVPLTEAVSAAHAFVFDQMRERLQLAKERSEVLLNELANPKP